MRTFIRRPGNKSRHLKYIMPFIPDFDGTYIEPFVGTGAVFLKVEPKTWILNDINDELMDLWKLVRDDPEFLLDEIHKLKEKLLSLDTQDKIRYCKEITEGIGDEKNLRLKSIKCHLMTYCSFESTLSHSYSSSQFFFTGLYKPLYESNSCHVFTDAYRDKIRHLTSVLSKGKGSLLTQDYREVLKDAKAGDFVFLDPPYVGDKSYTFAYNEDDGLDGSFVKQLTDELAILDQKKVKWIMTQVDSECVRDNFSKYTIVEINTNHGVCDKLKKCELMIMNY